MKGGERMRKCSRCEFWRRDGADGICFFGSPSPAIVEQGKTYVAMWPRSKPEDFCKEFSEKYFDAETICNNTES